MKAAYVHFRDIPPRERGRLAREAYRQSRSLRIIQHIAMGLSVLYASWLSDSFVAKNESVFFRIGVHILGAVTFFAFLWRWLGNWRLRAEVEKLKNAA